MNSPIKWAGGKRWLIPYLEPITRTYSGLPLVELFAGGASLSFHLERPYTMLNDLNQDLIRFYRKLKDGTPYRLDYRNIPEDYEKARHEFNESKDAIQILENHGDFGSNSHRELERRLYCLFYYLNRCTFNGLYRVNSKGRFNAPFGDGTFDIDSANEKLLPYAAKMDTWGFMRLDFRKAFELLNGKPHLWYADPPYVGTYTGFTKEGFTWADTTDLAKMLLDAKGSVIISDALNEKTIDLYKGLGYATFTAQTEQRIAANTENRGTRKELIAFRGWE